MIANEYKIKGDGHIGISHYRSINNPYSAVLPDYGSLTGNRLRTCPGMVGPIYISYNTTNNNDTTNNSSSLDNTKTSPVYYVNTYNNTHYRNENENLRYFCTSPDHGYCDRRSGTCFCNDGYQGLSCETCNLATHVEVGNLCHPRKECLNDCSGSYGYCNAILGKCECFENRSGEDCSQIDCHDIDEYCVQCEKEYNVGHTADDPICLECIPGYYFDTNERRCHACAIKHDPRCTACDMTSCHKCDDLLLTSIRRSGARPEDLQELPEDEVRRELSNAVPFGSSSTLIFEEAEVYYVIEDDNLTPLNEYAKECHQGLNQDDQFTCIRIDVSHRVCGHLGVFSFSSPSYQVLESDRYARVTIQRSGGGVGTVHVEYDLEHITTTSNDVSPTAFYTSSQRITFYPGEISKSILVTIHDDRIFESNETFALNLISVKSEDRSKIVSLGNQKKTYIVIIDDDNNICTSCVDVKRHFHPTMNVSSFSIITNGGFPSVDDFIFITKNIGEIAVEAPALHACTYEQDGMHYCEIEVTEENDHSTSMDLYQIIPHGLLGTYFNDVFFSGKVVSRVDSHLNFTWSNGSPVLHGGVDYFSVRWNGYIKSIHSELFTFTARVDDYIRLWIGRFSYINYAICFS